AKRHSRAVEGSAVPPITEPSPDHQSHAPKKEEAPRAPPESVTSCGFFIGPPPQPVMVTMTHLFLHLSIEFRYSPSAA
ncbi:hypothetical protein, partial [Edaphobacter sp. HDX4]|uniref:hypothetical protein n=1 Tax=Edaphobacter sp. HDX4 TaxID=2794064 RepID=UPI002FE53829